MHPRLRKEIAAAVADLVARNESLWMRYHNTNSRAMAGHELEDDHRAPTNEPPVEWFNYLRTCGELGFLGEARVLELLEKRVIPSRQVRFHRINTDGKFTVEVITCVHRSTIEPILAAGAEAFMAAVEARRRATYAGTDPRMVRGAV